MIFIIKKVTNLSDFFKFINHSLALNEINLRVIFSKTKLKNDDNQQEEIFRFTFVLFIKNYEIVFRNYGNYNEYLTVLSAIKDFRDNSKVHFPITEFESVIVGNNIHLIIYENEIGSI